MIIIVSWKGIPTLSYSRSQIRLLLFWGQYRMMKFTQIQWQLQHRLKLITPGRFKMAIGCVEVDLVSYGCHTAHNQPSLEHWSVCKTNSHPWSNRALQLEGKIRHLSRRCTKYCTLYRLITSTQCTMCQSMVELAQTHCPSLVAEVMALFTKFKAFWAFCLLTSA